MAEIIRRILPGFLPVRIGLLWAAVTVVCAVAGPFGTFHTGGFWARLIFWGLICFVALSIGWAVRARFDRMSLRKDSVWPAIVTATVSALVIGPFMHIFLRMWFRDVFFRLPDTTDVLVVIFLLTLGVNLLGIAIYPNDRTPENQSTDQIPRIVRRLDPALQGALLSVSVRDHYVDVRTDAGQGSILMRFSDAIAECAPVDGEQVHRSHWVAWSAIESVQKDGTRLMLNLVSGDSVPVSRNHREKLAARGLI